MKRHALLIAAVVTALWVVAGAVAGASEIVLAFKNDSGRPLRVEVVNSRDARQPFALACASFELSRDEATLIWANTGAGCDFERYAISVYFYDSWLAGRPDLTMENVARGTRWRIYEEERSLKAEQI